MSLPFRSPLCGLRPISLAAFACSALSASATCWPNRARLSRCASVPSRPRLHQATSQIAEPIEPIRPEQLIEVRRAFAEPIGAAETIARYIGKLAAQLCESLERKGLGARRLDLICHRVDSRAQAVRVGTGLRLRDAKRMTRLLCDRVETIDPGFGIESMTLAAILTEPLAPKQVASSLIEEREPDVSGLIDLLANRVGERNLYRIAPVASGVPERAVRHIPALAPETGAEWPGHWPRPSRLLAHPEPIETIALLPTIHLCPSLGAACAGA